MSILSTIQASIDALTAATTANASLTTVAATTAAKISAITPIQGFAALFAAGFTVKSGAIASDLTYNAVSCGFEAAASKAAKTAKTALEKRKISEIVKASKAATVS
jgi:hypothetical protein